MQGDLAGARELAGGGAGRIAGGSLGEEHPDTLRSKDNLATTLKAQGDLADARELEEEVLAASRGLLGEEHPDTLTSKNNLAATLWAQGDLAGARELQEAGAGRIPAAARRGAPRHAHEQAQPRRDA